MLQQRWMLRRAFILLLCITVSQQSKLLDLIKPKNIIHESFKLKTRVSDVSKKVVPSVLGPIVDSFDPEWLADMNYSRWMVDLRFSMENKNTDQWATKFNNLVNFDQVKIDVKSKIATKVSCATCKFIVNLIRFLSTSGSSNDEIVKVGTKICIILRIESPNVCQGALEVIGIDVIEAVEMSDMRPAQICSFLQGDLDGCIAGYDARHDWKVNLKSPTNFTSPHPTAKPADNVPRLKVLQISDTHYDPKYVEGGNNDCGEPVCCRVENGRPRTKSQEAGKYGNYEHCDAPLILLENALRNIAEKHRDIDYIMWTGDLPPHDVWNQTKETNIENLKVTAALMDKYFNGIPIFPSVGNHESCPVDSYPTSFAPERKNISWLYSELEKEWKRWLPESTHETIRRGAFYSVSARPGFRIIAINGNYCSIRNFFLLLNSTDPLDQLAWLAEQLNDAEAKGEKVHIIGHIPPGGNDCMKVWSRSYYDIINRYEGTIMAQFYGHTHNDEFEVFYDSKDFVRPINVGYISPSITPWELVNPAYRIYYVDGDHSTTTRSIIDHETWKMNLDEANINDNPVWRKAYSAREAYGMDSLLPKDWDNLITRMSTDSKLFDVYYRNFYRNTPVMPKCDSECKRNMLCNLRSGRSYDRNTLCRSL